METLVVGFVVAGAAGWLTVRLVRGMRRASGRPSKEGICGACEGCSPGEDQRSLGCDVTAGIEPEESDDLTT